jgi:phosphatidylglycerophosphatase A
MISFLATWFYLGKLPKAPGTFGSLGAIPFIVLLSQMSLWLYIPVVVLFVLFGIFICQVYESQNQIHDASEIVIDEVAGMAITMAFIPITWQSLLIGFLIFRVLDISKPFPIGYLDRKVTGGFGVMVDDIVAGLISNVLMQILLTYTSFLGVQQVVG